MTPKASWPLEPLLRSQHWQLCTPTLTHMIMCAHTPALLKCPPLHTPLLTLLSIRRVCLSWALPIGLSTLPGPKGLASVFLPPTLVHSRGLILSHTLERECPWAGPQDSQWHSLYAIDLPTAASGSASKQLAFSLAPLFLAPVDLSLPGSGTQ